MSWDTIVADPEFQALEHGRKQKIANNYFAKNFESDKGFLSLPEEKRFKIRSNFDATLKLEPSFPSRSMAGDVLSAAVRSPLRLGERIGSSLKYFDQPGGLDIARNIGETLTELPEKAAERFDIFKPSQQESKKSVGGLLRRAVTGGVMETFPSVAPAFAGGATGLAIGSMIPLPGAPIVGSYIGASLGTFGSFYTASYTEAYEDAIKQGIPEDKARSIANKVGWIQGGIEAVMTPITLSFAMGKNVLKNLFVAPAKEAGKAIISEAGKKVIAEGTEAVLSKSVRSVLTPTIKEAAKTIGKISAIEVPQEMVQDELDALVRRQAGMEAPAFGESAIEAAGPAAVMSILMGGGGHIYNKAYTGSVKRALQNPKGIDKEARLKAAQFTASTIANESSNPFLGQIWFENATKDIDAGKPISIDVNLKDLRIEPLEKPQKPKATGLKIEQPTKAEVPKFEPEPVIKVKGEGLKIEPVIEKPIVKKPIVSHEEDIIVKGEKPVSKPVIEELPQEREIPVTLTPIEKPRGAIPAKEIWDKTPMDIDEEWSFAGEYLRKINDDIQKQVKPLKIELSSLKGRSNKERKDELHAQIKALETTYKDLEGEYQTKSYDVSLKIRNQSIEKAKKLGLTNEDELEQFADDFLLGISTERPHIEVNYNKTVQQIFDETLNNYLEPQPKKEVIASEETKGQEAQRGLPLKPVPFVSVEDARSWIKQKSKEYGGRDQFLSSEEYKTAYPEVKRVFDEQKQKGKEIQKKAREVKIEKLSDGRFAIKYIQTEGYVASGGGLYGGIAGYNTETGAIEKANKLGLAIVPEQGTSPETKGMPAGEVSPVVSKEPWEMTRDEYGKKVENIYKQDISVFGGEHKYKNRFVDHYNNVKQAMAEGKPVPQEVLKDYPDLQQTHIMPSGEVMPGVEHKETLKAETPAAPISPIEAKIKKGIQERESPLTRKTLKAQMIQSGMAEEEVEVNIQLAIDAPAKALGITPDEFIQSSPEIKQVKASTMAELKGKDLIYEQSSLSDEGAREISAYYKKQYREEAKREAEIKERLQKERGEDISERQMVKEEREIISEPERISPRLTYKDIYKKDVDRPIWLVFKKNGEELARTKSHIKDKELLDYYTKTMPEVGADALIQEEVYLDEARMYYQAQEQTKEFYSHLEDVIEKSSQTKYEPQQLLNYLKKQAVKDAEIEATGLKEFLEGKTSVSKDELLEHLKGNQVEIKVKEYADKNIKIFNKRSEVVPLYEAGETIYGYDSEGSWHDEPGWYKIETPQELNRYSEFQITETKPNQTKFSQWVEPGGENYKEILLTLPQITQLKDIRLGDKIKDKYNHEVIVSEIKTNGDIVGKRTDNTTVFIRSNDILPIKINLDYRSPHYDEPNIVAHIRVDDRTDTTSKKVLFVEEIQSDWATDLRSGKDVPKFLFAKTWHELALKHIIRYASENGYDSIAWTTGEMQQNRYDLSKQIDSIQYLKSGDKFTIHAIKGGEKVIEKNDITISELENLVGKDIAKKIVEDKGQKTIIRFGQNVLDGKKLSGIDLKIGGEWAKRLYDEMISQFLNKYAKKWGGKTGKIYPFGEITLESTADTPKGTEGTGVYFDGNLGKSFYSQDEASEYAKLYKNGVQSLDITPSMRQSVIQEGQPLFQGNRGAIEFTPDGKAIIHILENADKSTFIHEMFHLYIEMMKRNPKFKAQLKILETWIGKPAGKWTVADNEKTAKSGEKYLWEGNAPTSALKAVFERFKTWLREIYKTAKSLDIELSDDVRQLWDEWFGGKKPEIEIKETATAESFTSVAKSSVGTLDNIDTIALSDIFKSEIDRGTPLNKLLVKRIVAGKLGVLVGDLIPEKGYKHKAIEEAYEYAIVKKGREIAQSDMSADEKFEATKKLYVQQLNLSERTSSSIEKQQYSTPLPLAMIINEHLGIDKNTRVYEPTAGNGMLLIGVNPKKTVVNELATDYRQTHLKDTGFKTIQGNAMEFIKDNTGREKSFDTVVMNPPFGNAQVMLFDNYRVRKLEHQIALESLKAMKDNGNAAIIIGGHNFEHGKMTESDRIFLNYLYSHYNVTHNIDINGDVYRRMGTSFPIRLLIVEGRKATPDSRFAPTQQTQVESANTFDDVRNRLGKPIQKGAEAKHEDIGKEPIAARLPGKEGAGMEGVVEGRQKGNEPTRGMRDIVPGTRVPDTGFVEQPGYSKDIVGDIIGEERGRRRTGIPSEVTRGEGVRPQELLGRISPTVKQSSRIASGNIQDPYIPQSKGNSGKNLIPKNLVEPIAKVLQNIENIYGEVDAFVQNELQYKTKEDLYDVLSAEQIDAVSIIISNIENGNSTILGDQTGVGKGRVVAAIIRYANLQGIKPIFFTEKPNLLTDIYRDLVNINHKVNPFILHSDSNSTILDQEGNKVFKPSFVGETKTNMIQDPAREMENFNVLMTTYSQINKENKQRAILRELARGNIIILDESHNAAGASNTGQFLSNLLETAKTVVYSSATYAKRPDNMAVYHKTDIGKTGLSVEDLTSAIKLGGIPLQQWVASALAGGGQYTRTELDYSGTNLDITVDIKNETLHTKQSDDITSVLRDIVKFDREKLKIIKEMDKEAVKEGKRTTGEASTAAGVTSSNFSSVVHNMVGQLLLSLRADTLIDNVIASVKAGRKPAITVMNTMETFLANAVDEGNVSIGDPIGFSFKDVLKKALKGTLRYTEISPGGERFKKVFKLEELSGSAQAIYRDIESKINSLETSLPSSPIDYVKSKLIKAGYTVGEITGRKLYIDYSETTPTLKERGASEMRNRNTIINDYNSGKIQILIYNAAGATGISLHSSEKFATAKEQRELFIWQPQLNIDTFKQAMGRVFRKGQVSKPRFTMIQTALPAEIRPTVVLQKKLASLNANTTANKESSAGLKDVPDMMNSYGDSVVLAYLKLNTEINAMLGDPLGIEADKENAVDAMQKVTGKVALLPIQIQRQFYDDIEMAYKELIEHLDQIGENNLHTKEYNFQAQPLEKQITNQGKDESNPFTSSTYLEKISVKVLKKPFTKAKIEELVKDSLKGKTAEEFNTELLAKIEDVTNQYKDTLEGELVEKRKEEIEYDINLIDYAFKKFKVGHSYSIPIIEDVYTPSVLVDIKHSKTSGNPAAPSKVHLVFAAAPPYQIYKTSLSRKEFISHADSTGEGIPSGWDELIPKEVRENRYVITGNLLQGFQRLGERAETINYTTESGEAKAGILLPRSTDINSLKEGGTTVGAKEAYDYMIAKNISLSSVDNEVLIRTAGGKAYISVPKSKADGAKYYLNKPLLSLLDAEFSSFGNSMRSHVDIEKLLPLLETLEQETSTRFSIPAKEVSPTETIAEKKEGEMPPEDVGKVFFQEAHKENFIANVVDKFSNWNEEKKSYEEAKKNGLIKEDISDDFRSKIKQWVSFPRTIAKKYPVFKRFYDRAEKYFEDVDNYATTMGNIVKPYMDSSNQETINKLLIDARLNKQYAYRKEELQKAGHTEEVIKEYLSVVNTMNQGLHYMTNMLNRSGNDIEEIYTFVSKVKGMGNLLKPYKSLENKDNINNVLSKTVWGQKVFRKQELIDLGLTEEERLAYNSITKLMYKNSNYIPFKRYGNWFVVVNDADGNLVEYSFHESQKEMRTEALEMTEKYPAHKIVTGNVKKLATEAYQNMPVSILTMLKEFDEQLDTEFSKVYANIVGRGFPLHLIEAKKIPGFEKDLSKSISDYILGISRWMAAKEARHDFSKMFVEKDAKGKLLLDLRKQSQLYGYTDRYVNYVLGSQKEGAVFRQFMFRYYLGGLVKSALLNFTQSLTTTLPTAAKYIEGSIIRRSRLMAESIKTAAIPMDRLKTTNPQLADALQRALKDVVISEQMVKMLRGEVYGKKLNRLDKILSYMFEFAEQSNRKIAFIMAYNEATNNGVKIEGKKSGYSVLNHEAAIKFAEDFVKETQFEYSKLNKSELMRGWKAPLFTFRVFAGNYLSLLKGMMLGGEWKALSEMLGIMLLLGGLTAFPGLKEIAKALELMGYDPKKAVKKKFGQWGDLSLHGILYPLGIDLSGALGTIEIVPGDIQQGIVPAVGGLVLGVPMDIPKRMGRAWTLLTKNKDIYRAVEAVMPEAIRNLMVAVRWIKEGEAKSPSYEPIAKVGGFDTALKFLGIQPATLSKAYEREHSESILRNLNYSEGYNWRIAKAIYTKDSDGIKGILEEIRAHNTKINKIVVAGDKEAVRKYILITRQGIQRNLLKMISPQVSELKSMPKVLRPSYREIQEVMK